MSLADEVLNLRSHATPRADAIELADKVRALESEHAEAVALLRHALMCDDDNDEARAFLARIDDRAKATTGTGEG